MLRIELSCADGEPVEFFETVTLPAESGGHEVVDPGQAVLRGRVERVDSGYGVDASIEGSAKVRCARCLGAFQLSYMERFRLEFQPISQAPVEDERQLKPGELDIRFYSDPVLDLVDLAAEQFQLALPMKPLCRDDCQGLCSRCGADLNRGRCACPANADPRWESLRSWRPGGAN